MSPTQVPSKAAPVRRPSPAVVATPDDRRRFLLTAGLWAVALLVLTVVFFRQFFTPTGLLTDPDTMDYAQIARNMAEGHGFATGILRPLAVSGFAGPDLSGTASDVSRAPLYPFLLMLTFMAHNGHGGAPIVIALSLVLFLLSVIGVYRLARTFFPDMRQTWIALLSAGLYGIGGEALNNALTGGPVMLATILVTALLIAMHRAAETPDRPAGFGSALWVGLLLGFCYLTQYSLLVLAPLVLVYLFLTRSPSRAWLGVAAGVLGFLIAAGPWMIRNAVVSHGNPFFTLLFYGVMAQTPDYPGETTIYRSVAPAVGPLAYFYTHLPDMLAKSGRGLTFYRDHILQVFNLFLLAPAAVALLWRAPEARFNAIRACGVLGILAIVVASSVFQPSVQMIAPFAPLIAVTAVGFIASLIAQQEWDVFLQRTVLWTLGSVVGLGMLIQFFGAKPLLTDPVAQGMQALTNSYLVPIDNPNHAPSDAIISDMPWETTWRTDVPTLWLPANNLAYQSVQSATSQSHILIRNILLTPAMKSYAETANEAPAWVQLSTHPDAYDTYLNEQRTTLSEMIANVKHDPNKRYTVAQAPMLLANYKNVSSANFEMNYGEISDVLADFQATPTIKEANQFGSTLFVRRPIQ